MSKPFSLMEKMIIKFISIFKYSLFYGSFTLGLFGVTVNLGGQGDNDIDYVIEHYNG